MACASFVRYYVGQIPHSLAWALQNNLPAELPQLNDWRWIPVDKFDYEKSFGYLPGFNVSKVGQIMKVCAWIVEHRDPAAVLGSSLIWSSTPESPTTLLDDIFTLCSVAKSQDIPIVGQETLWPNGKLEINQRVTAPASVLEEVIPHGSLGAFIKGGLTTLQQVDWKEDTGFKPAIFCFAQAQRSFRAAMFSLECSLYWVVLEILGLAYVRKHNLEGKITHKKNRVIEFLKSREFIGNSYSFLNNAIEDWYCLRNYAFHEGKLPDWSRDKFERRWRQLAEFASFVLADLLQRQSQIQRDQIGARLSRY